MQQIYKIDETRVGNIKKRALLRSGKVLLIAYLLILPLFVLQNHGPVLVNIVLPFLFTGLIIFFSISVAMKRIEKSYKSMQIILNDQGVETKADMMPFKAIEWKNLKIEEKSSGAINLYDMSVPTFSRKFYGRGWIIIQPETLEKDKLLAELQKHAGNY